MTVFMRAHDDDPLGHPPAERHLPAVDLDHHRATEGVPGDDGEGFALSDADGPELPHKAGCSGKPGDGSTHTRVQVKQRPFHSDL